MKARAERPSVLIGSLIALLGLAGLAESTLLARKAERATATMVDAVFVGTGFRGRGLHDLSVTFRTADGRHVRAVFKRNGEIPIYLGKEIAILYQSDDPARVRYDTFAGVWGVPLGLTAFGLTVVSVTLLASSRVVRSSSSSILRRRRAR